MSEMINQNTWTLDNSYWFVKKMADNEISVAYQYVVSRDKKANAIQLKISKRKVPYHNKNNKVFIEYFFTHLDIKYNRVSDVMLREQIQRMLLQLDEA